MLDSDTPITAANAQNPGSPGAVQVLAANGRRDAERGARRFGTRAAQRHANLDAAERADPGLLARPERGRQRGLRGEGQLPRHEHRKYD